MAANPLDQIDLALFKIAFPSNSATNLIPWIEPTRAACEQFGINTVREIASFLANIAVESRDLQSLTESLNYSVKGLRETFGKHRITDEQCRLYGRTDKQAANQEALANILYGGEFGKKHLGNTMLGDGWKFRGYGPKQITGRRNVTLFAKAMGLTIDEALKFLRTHVGGMLGAAWFWFSNGLDDYAATPGWEDDRKAINGGLNGIETVRPRANLLVKELLRRGC